MSRYTNMKHTLPLMFAAIVCLITACEHKPLILPDDETARVKVEFDWSEVAPADIPDNATLYFYTDDGDCIPKTLPTDQTDQYVVLPYGHYQLLVTTGSEEYVTPHPSGIPTHTLTLNHNPGGVVGQLLGTSPLSYDEPTNYPAPIAYAIDPIYAHIVEHLQLAEGTTTTTVIVKPRRVTARYNITVKNFKVDAKLAKIWGGAISGLNSALLPGKTLFADHCCPATVNPLITQPFQLDWDGTATTATATAYTFGTPDTQQPQYLYLYVWSDKSSCLAQTYNVTKIIADAPDPMNVDIVINFLGMETTDDELPFQPGVGEFEDGNEQEIIM